MHSTLPFYTVKVLFHSLKHNNTTYRCVIKNMQRFLAILAFYKSFVVWSFMTNAVVAFFNPHLVPGIVTKFFLTIFAWYYVKETNQRRKLTFYKNLGISPLTLFMVMFLVDCTLTIIFLSIFKEFT